ncbi:ornithine cyclodeaminase family protein [Alicyclobacillus dauci]|uniref:Ornithine cyclodeaminase family protein n=1 Tax=Alicyclobacillus dauci TaxID=1475485 RepID=A0ABY6Z987_9BACL|nr:ornithine cyclodeaminase family protein [Alicyclobacillus dauci]WAH38819.1 ornithine cyclodeaminase family protein [Alicyclobacillus dauci]
MDEHELMLSVKAAFQTLRATIQPPMRVKVSVRDTSLAPGDAEAMVLLPGFVSDIPAYTVKVHSKYPQNTKRGEPAIQGVIQLFDSAEGRLQAIIDSPLITAHRTAAASAVATDILAKPASKRLAVIGAGVQGDMHYEYVKRIRPIEDVVVFDVRPEAARDFCNRHAQDPVRWSPATNVADAVRAADIIVTATWSTEPFLYPDMVTPGVHIITLGPDEKGKVEVSQELIETSLLVCDDEQLCRDMGALNTFTSGSLTPVTLTSLLNGDEVGRKSNDDITIFGSVGLPFQDLVAAWHVYQRALDTGLGQRLF